MISKLLLTFILSSQMFLPVSSNDGQVLGIQTNNIENKNNSPQRIVNQNLDVIISAESVLVIDVKSGNILYQKNQNQQRPIASITKLMTMLVFLDTQPDFEEKIKYSWVDSAGGEKVEFKSGEEVTIENLFYSSLVGSKNNTTKTLVRSTGMSEKEFVNKMNQKAVELNLTQTSFKDATGLSEFNVSNARDIANLLKFVILKPKITKALSKEEYIFTTNLSQYKIESTNLLLNNNFFNIQFGKTGYIEEAGWCFTSFGSIDNSSIITVVLGSKNQYSRFQDTKALYSWVEENYKW